MNNSLRKKGVSAVVATVLIIMITVAAVGIIWAAIIPLVRNSIDKGTACFDAGSDISLVSQSGYTCINKNIMVCPSTHTTETNTTHCNDGNENVSKIEISNISVQVKKGPNQKIDLVGLEVLVFVGGSSESFRFNKTGNVGNMSGDLPSINNEKVLYIWDIKVKDADRVKIAPIVSIGKTEIRCEATEEVVLPPCA